MDEYAIQITKPGWGTPFLISAALFLEKDNGIFIKDFK